MNSLEDIVLSPAFAVLLAIVGAYLFVVISREFFLWYLKVSEVTSKLSKLDERLSEIEDSLTALPGKIQNNSELGHVPPPPSAKDKDSFPLQH